MQMEIKTITPEVAAVMLQSNDGNRNLRRSHVDDIARDMIAGRWQLNGDAIRLSCDGNILDGQHRLAGCVKSGVPFETIVISGLSSDVRATIDGGAKRSHGDRLGMRGVPNANATSAVLRTLIGIATGRGMSVAATPQELDAVLVKHPGVSDSVHAAQKAFKKMHTALAAVHYIGCATGRADDARAFVEVFRSGVPHYPGCAAHKLRERMIQFDGGISEYSTMERLYATTGMWRHFIARTSIRVIKLPADCKVHGWTPDRLGI